MRAKHLVTLADLSADEVWEILGTADLLKKETRAGRARPLLEGKVLGMLFQKPSLRTRVSFEVAMLQLGGHAMYLSPNEVQLGMRESTPDAARVLSRYVDGIVARTFAHRDVELLAQYATVPVINGLSDLYHPCQALADLLTVQEKLGELRGVRLAFVGDGNNVAHSLLLGGSKTGMHVVVASPPGYECRPDIVAVARAEAEKQGGSITLTLDPQQAVSQADIVCTDVWTSMGQEEEAEGRRRVFGPYQVNADLITLAKPDVLVMHCLPAHRGEEITDEVIEGPRSVVFDEAENRLHAQKAVLVLLLSEEGRWPGLAARGVPPATG